MFNLKQKYIEFASAAIILAIFAFWPWQNIFASPITSETIIELVNQSRLKKNLAPLFENAKLTRAAEEKAQDMIDKDYFEHISPQNTTPWFWIEKNNYDYKFAGENLAMNFSDVEKEHQAWMKSPTHEKNILNANYQEIGVAVKDGVISGQPTTIAVQMFGARPDFVPSQVLGEEKSNLLNSDRLPFLADTGKSKTAVSQAPARDMTSVEWATLATLAVLWLIMIADIIVLAYFLAEKAVFSKKGKAGANLEAADFAKGF